MNSIRGSCHADFVNRFSPAVDPFPLSSGNVKELPFPVEATDFWPADNKRLIRRIADHRPAAQSFKGLSLVITDCSTNGNIERHRFTTSPAGIPGSDLLTLTNNGHRVRPEFIKLPQFSQR